MTITLAITLVSGWGFLSGGIVRGELLSGHPSPVGCAYETSSHHKNGLINDLQSCVSAQQ